MVRNDRTPCRKTKNKHTIPVRKTFPAGLYTYIYIYIIMCPVTSEKRTGEDHHRWSRAAHVLRFFFFVRCGQTVGSQRPSARFNFHWNKLSYNDEFRLRKIRIRLKYFNVITAEIFDTGVFRNFQRAGCDSFSTFESLHLLPVPSPPFMLRFRLLVHSCSK